MDFIARKDINVKFDRVLYFQASNRSYKYYKLLVGRSNLDDIDFNNYFLFSSSVPNEIYLPQVNKDEVLGYIKLNYDNSGSVRISFRELYEYLKEIGREEEFNRLYCFEDKHSFNKILDSSFLRAEIESELECFQLSSNREILNKVTKMTTLYGKNDGFYRLRDNDIKMMHEPDYVYAFTCKVKDNSGWYYCILSIDSAVDATPLFNLKLNKLGKCDLIRQKYLRDPDTSVSKLEDFDESSEEFKMFLLTELFSEFPYDDCLVVIEDLYNLYLRILFSDENQYGVFSDIVEKFELIHDRISLKRKDKIWI